MDYVQNIIDKNVQLLPNGEIGLTDEENFIHENLRIPAEWIFYSKAVLAVSSNKWAQILVQLRNGMVKDESHNFWFVFLQNGRSSLVLHQSQKMERSPRDNYE